MSFDFYKNKVVLITGDTGFKGSWLAIWLHKLGAKVYGFSKPPKSEHDNFIACNLDEKIIHFDGDIRNFKNFYECLKEIKPEIIFHLAAQALVLKSYSLPLQTFETNIMGTVNLLEIARLIPEIKVIINATSDKCYENNELNRGYKENDQVGGRDPYSASKGAAEIVSSSYMRSFFLDKNNASAATVRAGNVIGAGDWSLNRIVPDFFRSKKNNSKLLIRNPNSTRPWQHVLEPLRGYMLLACKLYEEGKMFQGGWNFGPNPAMTKTVLALINELSSYGKVKIDISEHNYGHEANLLKLNIIKARKLLKWKPVLNFKNTIKITAEGYINQFNNQNVYKNRLDTIDLYCSEAAKKDQLV